MSLKSTRRRWTCLDLLTLPTKKTLIELKNFTRGGLEDMSYFLVKMQTLDEVVTDFPPPIYDSFIALYSTKFVHEAIKL